MTKAKVGDLVQVYEKPGEPPYDAIVQVVDGVTGIIKYVKRADDKGDALVDVSMNIVLLIQPFVTFVKWFKSLFRKKSK